MGRGSTPSLTCHCCARVGLLLSHEGFFVALPHPKPSLFSFRCDQQFGISKARTEREEGIKLFETRFFSTRNQGTYEVQFAASRAWIHWASLSHVKCIASKQTNNAIIKGESVW